jgi:hypothetical protein
VVSLRGLCSLQQIIVLAELNNLTLWVANLRSVYLEATTKEILYFTTGEEFGPLAGHKFFVVKALYG